MFSFHETIRLILYQNCSVLLGLFLPRLELPLWQFFHPSIGSLDSLDMDDHLGAFTPENTIVIGATATDLPALDARIIHFLESDPECQNVVIRCWDGQRLADAFREQPAARRAVLLRIPNRRLWIIGSAVDPINALWEVLPDGPVERFRYGAQAVREIGGCDLSMLIRRGSAIGTFAQSDHWHYETPSGLHATRFLRVADLIRSSDDVERLAFWLAFRLREATAVLVDTAGILAPIYLAMQRLGRAIPVECLPGHPWRGSFRPYDAIRRLQTAAPGTQQLHLIVSVESSGRLTASVMEACDEEGLSEPCIVPVFAFPSAPHASDGICVLTSELDPSNQPADSCGLCTGVSRLVRLDAELYAASIEPAVPVCLGREHARPGREFLTRYSAYEELFQLHYRQAGQCDPYHIRHDVLLGLPPFSERLKSNLRSLGEEAGTPDAVLYQGQGGKQFADMIADLLGLVAYELSDDGVPALRSAVVAIPEFKAHHDVGGPTASLRARQPKLERVAFLVGLARPPSMKALKAARTAAVVNNPAKASFLVVECILLPPEAGDVPCPWCEEERILQANVARGLLPHSEGTATRLVALQAQVLENPLRFADGVSPRLGHGSVFADADASAVVVCFALAMGVQQMREAGGLSPGFPLWRALSAEKMLGNYSEGLLRAAILRVVAVRDWSAEVGVQAASVLLDAHKGGDSGDLLGEWATACLRGLVPWPSDADVLGAFGAAGFPVPEQDHRK